MSLSHSYGKRGSAAASFFASFSISCVSCMIFVFSILRFVKKCILVASFWTLQSALNQKKQAQQRSVDYAGFVIGIVIRKVDRSLGHPGGIGKAD